MAALRHKNIAHVKISVAEGRLGVLDKLRVGTYNLHELEGILQQTDRFSSCAAA